MDSCDGNYSPNHKFLARSKGKQRISKSILRWTTVCWVAPDCLVCVPSSQRCPCCLLSCSFPWFLGFFPPLTFVFRVPNCRMQPVWALRWLLTNRETGRPASSRRLCFCLCGSLIISQKVPGMRRRGLVMWNTSCCIEIQNKALWIWIQQDVCSWRGRY